MGDATAVGQIIAPLVGIGGVVVGSLMTWTAQTKLLGKRIEADERLAERKFASDRELAERKFKYDIDFNERKRNQEIIEDVVAKFYESHWVLRTTLSPWRSTNFGGTYEAIFDGIDQCREVVNRALALKFVMMSRFGQEASEPFDRLESAFDSVLKGSEQLAELCASGEVDQQKRQELAVNVLWGMPGTANRTRDIEKAVENLKNFCEKASERVK